MVDDDRLINESYSQRPGIFWGWLFLLISFALLVYSIQSFVQARVTQAATDDPFLQVTNRQFSVFLWQHPEFMRTNVSNKLGYLPDFQYINKVTVEPDLADRWVVAPPEILFLYHTWKRLLGDLWIPTRIGVEEFLQFLNYAEEWQPEFWPDAPASYRELVVHLEEKRGGDLASELPQEVRLSFQGWKNYTKQGNEIAKFHPTKEQIDALIARYPQYAKPFWKNLVADELPAFLRTAVFNANSKFIPESS